jgi:hypothetical protein
VTTVKGWTSGDLWAFEQLLIKANTAQLHAAIIAINGHLKKRNEERGFV